MNSGTGKLTTKTIAVIIIVAVLNAVGLSPVVMVFVTGIVFVIWLVTRRAQMREVERIFEFYVAADAILREEERRWGRNIVGAWMPGQVGAVQSVGLQEFVDEHGV